MKRQASQPPRAPGEIRRDSLYTFEEVAQRLKLAYRGMRALQESGLRFIVLGKAKYIRGETILQFFQTLEQGTHDD